MPEHTHLDQRRRDPGECPACDDAWHAQAAITDEHRYTVVAERHGHADRMRLAELGRRRYRGHR